MGTRGQNKTGYYVAVLYALDVCYQTQNWQGLPPRQWSPAPRQRPEQFLHWTRTCLSTLGVSPGFSFSTHLSALRTVGLPHIASMLEEHTSKIDPQFSESAQHAEQHPQARKIATQLRARLDAGWLERLRNLAAPKTPDAALALALGGLPPGHGAVLNLLERLLLDHELPLLSPLQGFTLATGCVPTPPEPWQVPLAALAPLTPVHLVQLNSLSRRQLDHLQRLDPAAIKLLALRDRVSCSDDQWYVFGTTLLTLKRDDVARIAAALARSSRRVRLHLSQGAAQGAAYLLAYWPATSALLLNFKDALTEPAWHQATVTSAELRRSFARGELPHELLECLRSWDEGGLTNVRDLLRLEPILSWCEDTHLLAELDRQRSAAWLGLADIFPTSTAYLSGVLSAHYREALLANWEDIEPLARQVSERLQQAWYEQVLDESD